MDARGTAFRTAHRKGSERILSRHLSQELFALMIVDALLGCRAGQRDRQYVFHGAHVMDAESLKLFAGQVFFDICLVVSRKNHGAYAGALGSKDFLFYASDGKNVSA